MSWVSESSVSARSRAVVRDLVVGVSPHDEREAADRQWMLDWVDSGADLFRVAKPATPPQHLAVYAALLDEDTRSVMLVDHAKAKAWLFPSGHVDLDHLLIYGQRHLRSVLNEYERHYNAHRPHQGAPLRDVSRVIDMTAHIQRRTILAGLVREYHRAA